MDVGLDANAPGVDAAGDDLMPPMDAVVIDGMTMSDASADAFVSLPEAAVIASGDLTLVWRPDYRRFELRHQGTVRMRLPLSGFQIGLMDAVDNQTNYDPFYIHDDNPGTDPIGLRWVQAESASLQEGDATQWVQLTFPGVGEGRLSFVPAADRRISVLFTPPEGPIAFLRFQPQAPVDEAYYGLGEVFDHVNHRGKVRAMQLVLDTNIESANNEAHVPIPVLYGHTGWGVFVESYRPGVFAVATQDDETVDVIFGTGLGSADGLNFHLFTEDHPLDLTQHYFGITGAPALPAEWAYGPWVWRDENEDQAQVISDVETIRELDLATSGYWIDRPYARAVNSFDWHPENFPQPEAMVDRIHELGFRFALWHAPYLGLDGIDNEDTTATLELRAFAEENSFFPLSIGLATSKWGPPLDLTNPDAYLWFQNLIRRYTDIGVEGFKLDYAEDIVPGLYGRRAGWDFADGSNDQTMHALYQDFYHRVYADLLPDTGGFLLCRSATWGEQRTGVIIWPGDLDANLSLHRERVETEDGGSYIAVGGLGASMIAGLSLGPSGFAFYGSDTGGYRNAPPNRETFIRWFQQTALSSIMQIGTNTNDVAWELGGDNGFDQASLDLYRIFTRLHLRLFPYAWSYAAALPRTGRPIQRPFGWQHPELDHHPWDTYFFGDDLLVAPVVLDGQREREVMFPPGRWYDWWTGDAVEGGEERTVAAPLDTLPLYLRAGGIIPMLRPNIDTLSPVVEPGIESYANDPGRLYVRVALPGESVFTLHDDTQLRLATSDEGVRLTAQMGTVFQGGLEYEVWGLESGEYRVSVDGAEVPNINDRDTLAQQDSGFVYEDGRMWIRAANTSALLIQRIP